METKAKYERTVEAIPELPAPPDLWVAKMQARRSELVMEQGKAGEQFKLLQQRLMETQGLLERLNGAIAVLDEMLKPTG